MSYTLLERIRATSSLAVRQSIITEAQRAGQDLLIEGVSLAGHDLSGLWLTPLELRGVDFRGSLCNNATLPPLVECALDGVDASGSSFARLDRCSFKNAVLNGCFLGGRMRECDFSHASLTSARIGQILSEHIANGDYGGNTFARANMDSLDAAGAYLVGTCFVDANLRNARLSRSDLGRADVRNTTLTGANLVAAHVDGADWLGSNVEGCAAESKIVKRLHSAGATHTDHMVVTKIELGPATAALELAIEPIVEFNLQFEYVRDALKHRERILITRERESEVVLCGAAFRADRVVLRTYPWEGPRQLSVIVGDIAADYANWNLDLQSIRVGIGRTGPADHILRLFREALAEVSH